MKLIDSVLYIEFADLVECGVSDNYLRKAKSKGTKIWSSHIPDPKDNRKTLFVYEDLADKYRGLIKDRLGDPYLRVVREPILKMVRHNHDAYKYFMAYRYGDDQKALPIDVVKKYVRADSWLRMLKQVKEDTSIVRKGLNIRKMPDFYLQVSELIDTEKHRGMDSGYTGGEQLAGNFASSYSRMMKNVEQYAKEGFDFLIDKRFGNSNSAKVKTGEVSEALLLELLNHKNQYDDKFISISYNREAEKLGLSPISVSTVRVWREKNKHIVTAGREGWQSWNSEYGRRTHRARPSQPTYLWESDDNHLDLLYWGDDGSPYHRMKAIFVTDSHCDLVLGVAYAEELSIGLVRRAYLNAMYYIKQLTGGWYLPHEVKTDRWALKALEPFYSSMGHYYPTPVGSKNRGWIENFFGTADWKRCMKVGADNYTGNNITAKRTGANLEMLNKNKNLYPHIKEAPKQIEAFVHRLRHVDINGKGSREQQWLDKWNALPTSERREIDDEMMLSIFGLRHELNSGQSNSITKSGIELSIAGVKYKYSVPDALYLKNVGRNVAIQYDPNDMSRVLVTGDEGLRFVASSVQQVPGTFRDMQLYGEGGRTLLNVTLDGRRADVERVGEKGAQRAEQLRLNEVDVEQVLRQGGRVNKQLMQQAEKAYLSGDDNSPNNKDRQKRQDDFLDGQVNYSDYE